MEMLKLSHYSPQGRLGGEEYSSYSFSMGVSGQRTFNNAIIWETETMNVDDS
jgi:hypothetical protein